MYMTTLNIQKVKYRLQLTGFYESSYMLMTVAMGNYLGGSTKDNKKT